MVTNAIDEVLKNVLDIVFLPCMKLELYETKIYN